MSEPIASLPPGGRTVPGRPAGTAGGTLLSVVCWLAFLGSLAVAATAAVIREGHLAGADRRAAIAVEQRITATAIAKLVDGLPAGPIPGGTDVSALRAASLDLLARMPAGPVAGELYAEWVRLVTGLDVLRTDWARILAARNEIEELRASARDLVDATANLADALSAGAAGSLGPATEETLSTAARLFALEAQDLRFVDAARLDRVGALLELLGRARGSLAAEFLLQPGVPALHPELAAVDTLLGANHARMKTVREMATSLEPVSDELRGLADASAAVAGLLPEFEALGRRPPMLFGLSPDTWLFRAAGICVAAVIGLVWRRQRLLKAETAALDRAWVEAAESDWRARVLVRDLIRAVGSLGSRGRPAATARATEDDDLDESVRDAARALPRIVARRARLAGALLAAREPLRRNLSAARDAALGRSGPAAGGVDEAPLVELDRTFWDATLFAMAALARELRAAVAEPAGAGEASAPAGRTAGAPDEVREVVERGFDRLERCLERVLDGEEEERTTLLYLIDDLRTVRGRTRLTDDFEFNPELGDYSGARTGPDPSLKREAARMLPSFRKGLDEWTGAGTDGNAAAKLMRGSVSVLARSAEEGTEPAAPERGFWTSAAAFCTAVSEDALPSGPAVRRILEGISGEFRQLAEGESGAPPSAGLFREVLAYIALAECDHQDLQEVRTSFGLDGRELSLPEPSDGAGPDDRATERDVSREIIHQLEGIRAALDRINRPPEGPPDPSPRA